MEASNIDLLEPTPELERELAGNLREGVRLEIERQTGLSPLDAVRECVQKSASCRFIRINGEMLAGFGVASYSWASGIGSAWCFTTDLVNEHRELSWFLSKFYLRKLLHICPRLEVLVDPDFDVAVRWLKRLGFVLSDDVSVINGHPFTRATIGGEEDD